MKRREGQVGSTLFTGWLEKVTQLIDKPINGLTRLNDEQGVWFRWFVGEDDAQIIHGRCPTSEYRLWDNLSVLTDNGQWLAMRVTMLEGKKWQVNPDPESWKLIVNSGYLTTSPYVIWSGIHQRYGGRNRE